MGTIVDVTEPDAKERLKTTVEEALPEGLGSDPESLPSAKNSADVNQEAQGILQKRERRRQKLEANNSTEKKQNENADGIDMTDFGDEIVHTSSGDNFDWDKSSDSEHNTEVEDNSSSNGGDSDETGDNIPDERGLPKLVLNKELDQ
ncbi:hypothetical protein SARC_03145 [Sphaeroforma arctica JP610]|uniref:Uncharacterized protein n=1 Tax=Sphaeroforma arctica JP610 TaxID=667725 RepID=A0A0L0G6V5_9EUKA|nr:hypothetical protein SARC_03145 [Sphaeroforma arctica JP610]KNC84654.1 hypothetical protein SARC_03145 [Sphaeroforma arctica JP610]|eukprot:XP_014158556.1 hypothetical protein SARC_03145 [Sphaeroforma arctica JP610]